MSLTIVSIYATICIMLCALFLISKNPLNPTTTNFINRLPQPPVTKLYAPKGNLSHDPAQTAQYCVHAIHLFGGSFCLRSRVWGYKHNSSLVINLGSDNIPIPAACYLQAIGHYRL